MIGLASKTIFLTVSRPGPFLSSFETRDAAFLTIHRNLLLLRFERRQEPLAYAAAAAAADAE